MSHPRRRFSKVALSLCLTAVMAVGGSAGVASAHGFDAAEKPIDLGDPQLMMTVAESQHIAKQLPPVPGKIKLRRGPHPAVPEWVKSDFKDDPFMEDDAWHYVDKGYKQGQIIRKRKSLWSQVYYPGSHSMQYAFVSYDSRGYPMTATATLVVPPIVKRNAGIVQWNEYINSSGTKCKVTTQLNQPNSWGIINSPIELMSAALALGYPVLFTDAEGPRNSYAINRLSAHVMLDSMRMVHQQHDFPLQQSHFVSMGISHGGLQTGYTAVEQPNYAPELAPYIEQYIVNEGAPDFIKLAHSMGLYGQVSNVPSAWGGFLVSFLIGMMREYGDLLPHMEQWLTPYGKKLIKANRNLCMPFTLAAGGGGIFKYLVKDGFFRSKTFKTALRIAKDSSSFYNPTIPTSPILLVHGKFDGILYQAEQDEVLWQRYCNAGANAVYEKIPFTGHMMTPGVSTTRMFLRTVLSLHGVKQLRNCLVPVII